MAIHDRNELIFLSYDSIVSYERVDYFVSARYNYSNPVVSFLLYEIKAGAETRYLWYDKKEHRIAILDLTAETDLSKMQTILTDDFHVQIEVKTGAPSIFQTRLGIYMSGDKKELAVKDVRSSESLFFTGAIVEPAHITIFPYDER